MNYYQKKEALEAFKKKMDAKKGQRSIIAQQITGSTAIERLHNVIEDSLMKQD